MKKPITIQLEPMKGKDGKTTFRLRPYDTITHNYLPSETIDGVISYRKGDAGEERAKDLKNNRQTEINNLLYKLGNCDYYLGYNKYMEERNKAAIADKANFYEYFEYIVKRKPNEDTRGLYLQALGWLKRFVLFKYQTETLTFATLSEQMHPFHEDFKSYLLNNVGHQSEYKKRFGITNQNSCRNLFADFLQLEVIIFHQMTMTLLLQKIYLVTYLHHKGNF